MQAGHPRDYEHIRRSLASATKGKTDSLSREMRMQAFVDACWPALHQTGVSWIGFYLDRPAEPADRRMILGPRRDKPACSPIGLHGVCGQALIGRATRIVQDVAELGASYIACDPRDRSEIVIPLFENDGVCWGVLDVDSWEVGAFDESDERGFTAALRSIGLTSAACAG